jgi:hypothetical protein
MWLTNPDEYMHKITEGEAISTSYSYEFHGGEFVTAFNNNPNLLNLRNDYSIWGERESISGAKMPIHMRYAIDKKPTRYRPIWTTPEDNLEIQEYNKKYNTSLSGRSEHDSYLATITAEDYDWREVIYTMAQDYYKYNILNDFELRVAAANPIDYPTGRTGYEQYYIDLQGFWRELYYPDLTYDISVMGTDIASLEAEISVLKEEVYGIEVDYSDNLLGGIENDLVCLNNYVSAATVPGGFATAKSFIASIVSKYKFKNEKK